ncbi:MAG: cation:dicarboxylate symporter family transporter, partial [Rubripirellula sp.]
MSQTSPPMAEAGNGAELIGDLSVAPKRSKLGLWIALGLVLGVACGLLFGDYCGHLQVLGQAYVGLLQMTVLPYLLLSLVSKMGRLDPAQAKK